MPKKLDKIALALRWLDMLKAQEKDGFDLTVRELMVLWGLATTSAVAYILATMEREGLVKAKQHGKSKVYRALNEYEVDWVHYYEMDRGADFVELDKWQQSFGDAAQAGLIEEEVSDD